MKLFILAFISLFMISCTSDQALMLDVAKKVGIRIQEKNQINTCSVTASSINNISPKKGKDFIFSATPRDSNNYIKIKSCCNDYGGYIEIGSGLLKNGKEIDIKITHYYNSMVKGRYNEWWDTRFVFCGRWEYAPKKFDDVVVVAWWTEKFAVCNHAVIATRKHGWISIKE